MYKKLLASATVLLFPLLLLAQFSVQFRVKQLPSYHRPADTIYLVGSFNRWNPKDSSLRLQTVNGETSITIPMLRGTYEYKFTRGGWDSGEAGAQGSGVENRRITICADTVVDITIAGWADHFPQRKMEHTATKNVHIVDTAFFIPQLNRYRRVWIYLPESYNSSRKKYPVMYMHDGQNVFDAATSGFGEWGVDETLDTLGPQVGEMIVVAVDNGGDKRLNEYSPYDMAEYGRGEGNAYVDFLVNTLRPYINKHYRTKKCGKHTFVAGSSMGGLISFYAILKYPKLFGGAGVFSPAFWITPQLKNIDPKQAKKVKGKIYFFAGQQEGETMVPDMLNVLEQMMQHSKAKMHSVIRAAGRHNEATWRAEFPLFYKWILNAPLNEDSD
jgi:predicted alpha/beta superfamily hydrolase